MYREFYSALASPALPLVVMAFFVASFTFVLLRVLLVKRRHDYDDIAALPLDDAAAPDSPSSDSSEPSEVRS